MAILKTYKFYLSFENANLHDYVTEKFFQALASGTVPIVMGAPNIDEYTPGAHSIIRVTDYPSARRLAEYIHKLDGDDELYEQYFQWKDVNANSNYNGGPGRLPKHFTDIQTHNMFSAPCRVCEALHKSIYVNSTTTTTTTTTTTALVQPEQSSEQLEGSDTHHVDDGSNTNTNGNTNQNEDQVLDEIRAQYQEEKLLCGYTAA